MSRTYHEYEAVKELGRAFVGTAAVVALVLVLGRCIQSPDTPKPIDPTGDGFYILSGCEVTYAEGGRNGVIVPNPTGDPEYLFIPPGAVAAWDHSNAVPISTDDLH